MDANDFVKSVHSAVYRTTIEGILRILANPPGRRPRPDLADTSRWFHDLSGDDKEMVKQVVRLSVDHAVFGMLASLDGERALARDGTDLTVMSGGVAVNAQHDLHERFRQVVDEELGYT